MSLTQKSPIPLLASAQSLAAPRVNRPRTMRPPYLRVVVAAQRDRALRERHAMTRRVLNVAVALIGIAVTLPLWIVIAILIKLTSRGPVFHTQVRVGVDARSTRGLAKDPRRKLDMGGRPFTIYKFRSMRESAERHTGPVWATQDDPRVTPIGRLLRKYRLDELPQLINVLKGEMNVVGPRPERPTIFSSLREEIPQYQARQRTRPGITGLAQVSQQYDASIEDVRRKVQYDLEYIRRQSIWEDLRIMAATVPVMLRRKGGW